MCGCSNKIGMKRRKHRIGAINSDALMSGVLDGVLGGTGAIAAQEFGAIVTPMIPATMLAPGTAGELVDAAKIVLGCVLPAMVPGEYHEHAKAIGIGFAAQGGLNLFNTLMATPTYVRVGGADNRMYALAGADNRMYALAGGRRYRVAGYSTPQTRSTYSTARGL
jgi:hypothetical protein